MQNIQQVLVDILSCAGTGAAVCGLLGLDWVGFGLRLFGFGWVGLGWVDASRRGKKMLDSPGGKNESTCRSGEGGGGPAIDPGSELLLGGSTRAMRG